MKKRCFSTALIMFFAVTLFSCAHLQKAGTRDDLHSRVKLEWESKTKRDWAPVYDLSCKA